MPLRNSTGLASIEALAKEMISTDRTELIRMDLADENADQDFSFRELETVVRDSNALVREVIDLPLNKFPWGNDETNAVAELMKRVKDRWNEMHEFTKSQDIHETRTTHNKITTGYLNDSNAMHGALIQIISYLRSSKSPASELLKEMKHEYGQVHTLAKRAQDQVNLAEQALSILGASESAPLFEDQASDHSKASKYWLGGSIGVSAVMLLSVVLLGCWYVGINWSFLPKQIDPKKMEAIAIPFTLTKILYFSILYTVLAWSLRNYRAHKHNETVNHHRAQAIRTLPLFAKQAEEKDVRNAVLLKTTEVVFGHASSGYLTKEPEDGRSSQIIEIFRGAMGQGK